MPICIWNFFGPRSLAIAEHFLEHTQEFLTKNNCEFQRLAAIKISDNQAQVHLEIKESLLETIQKALRPNTVIQ